MPHEMLQTTINDTNATICSNCAIDAKPRELCVGRTFSFRNGFGPIINYEDDPESLVLYYQNMQIGIRLQHLIKNLTLVEESAIRQLTPMLHIVRLTHGGYGTTGNTSLVWQKSKLHTVLSNLPSTCKYICIEKVSRSNNGGNNRMVQTKFEREKIGEVLELLQHTVVGVWAEITLSQDNLNIWPKVVTF